MSLDEVLEITTRIENIDGEDVFVLDRTMYLGIQRIKEKVDEHKNDLVLDMLKKNALFISNVSGFAIGFRFIRGKKNKWLPCLLYKYEGIWRRVNIRHADCLECDWTGLIATPMDPELYEMMENWYDILQNMKKLHFLNCPRCGGKISGRAIWIEECREKSFA